MRVIRALGADPARWRHGYDLGTETGLKAGSLYPILVRLADRGLLEAAWEDPAPRGRPARHLYRLTPDGRKLAPAAIAAEIDHADSGLEAATPGVTILLALMGALFGPIGAVLYAAATEARPRLHRLPRR
jgi:DNA-binding MarR family transcriptional regulator